MNTLLSVSIALLAGLLMTRVFKPLKLPAVTAYLIAGVLIGPYCIGAIGIGGIGFPTFDDVEKLALISEVALGFIAFSKSETNFSSLITAKVLICQSIITSPPKSLAILLQISNVLFFHSFGKI